MTTRIYLLRHGIAVPHGTAGVNEDDRPLTPKGEGRVKEIAEGLRRLEVKPDRILTSPLPRARQTAEIVTKVLDLENRLEHAHALLPRATAGSIREWLGTRPEEGLMLVGHNPNLTDLLGLLLGLPGEKLAFDLKKGGVAKLRSDGRVSYQLQWLASPRLLRRLQD